MGALASLGNPPTERLWVLWTHQRVINRARGQGGQQVLNFVHFLRTGLRVGEDEEGVSKSQGVRVQTCGVFIRQNGHEVRVRAFDILLENTGRGWVAASPTVRIISASAS